MSLAEKFQITIPPKRDESAEKWATFDSAHRVDAAIPQGGGAKLNRMPQTNITEKHAFVQGFGGNTDVTDCLTPNAFDRGFTRHDMTATDDQYGGEHIDLFYGEAKDELGNIGFCERQNYCDRL